MVVREHRFELGKIRADTAALAAEGLEFSVGHGAVTQRGIACREMPDARTPAEWMLMADDARAVAVRQRDCASKLRMIGIADAYDAMARYAAHLAFATLCAAMTEECD